MSNSSDPSLHEQAGIPPETLHAALELWEQTGEVHWIPVRGTSMLPMLRQGDQLLVAHGSREMRLGDIVVFRRSDGLIAHRVLRVLSQPGKLILRTKGDHVLALDPILDEDLLMGRVLRIRRGERMLGLDTRLWRWLGRWVAMIMWAQAGLYHRYAGGFEGWFARAITYLCWGIVRFNGFCLNAIQAIFGRWQGLAKMQTGG